MPGAGSNYVPPWIRYMQRDTGTWGFIIYRCASYNDPDRWDRYRAALDLVWENAWQHWWRSYQRIGVTEEMYQMAKARMDLMWVEDDEMQGTGIDQVRSAFKMLQQNMPVLEQEPRLAQDPWNLALPIPYHKDRQVCLYVDEDCVTSLLGPPNQEIPLPDSDVAALRKHVRYSYITAVDANYNPEFGYVSSRAPIPYSGWAKIGVGVIFTELCHRRIHVNDMLPLDQIYSQASDRTSSGGLWKG